MEFEYADLIQSSLIARAPNFHSRIEMCEYRQDMIPVELYSAIIMATGSIGLASRALPETVNSFLAIPISQRQSMIQLLKNKVKPIVDDRAVTDTQFKSRFGKRLFRATTDDARVIVDLSTPCEDEVDFVHKIQALIEIITRIRKDVKELIRNQRVKQKMRGSIDILKAILHESFSSYDPEIISNLRQIKTLGNRFYPTHIPESEAIKIMVKMGFTYPPNDWNEVWKTVLDMCSGSFGKLRDLFAVR